MSLSENFFISTVRRPTEDEALRHLTGRAFNRTIKSVIVQRTLPPPLTLIPLRQKNTFWKEVASIKSLLQNGFYWRKTRRGWRSYNSPVAIVLAMIQDGHSWVHLRHVEEALGVPNEFHYIFTRRKA